MKLVIFINEATFVFIDDVVTTIDISYVVEVALWCISDFVENVLDSGFLFVVGDHGLIDLF